MTTTLHGPARSSADHHELLRGMLEEQFAVHTARLTQLTVHARHAAHDPGTLDALIASTRERIAETAQALRRMSEGTYGLCVDCHKPLPLGRLHALPHATHCTRCERRRTS